MFLKNSLPQVNALQIRQYCFYSCPYRARLFVYILYPGRCPGLWRYWAFSPHYMSFEHPLF